MTSLMNPCECTTFLLLKGDKSTMDLDPNGFNGFKLASRTCTKDFSFILQQQKWVTIAPANYESGMNGCCWWIFKCFFQSVKITNDAEYIFQVLHFYMLMERMHMHHHGWITHFKTSLNEILHCKNQNCLEFLLSVNTS